MHGAAALEYCTVDVGIGSRNAGAGPTVLHGVKKKEEELLLSNEMKSLTYYSVLEYSTF
jgi:hypothetical protein